MGGKYMFNLGFSEMLLIFIIALVVFGPDRLPEIGKTLGQAIREFRKASTDLQKEIIEVSGQQGNNDKEQN